MDFSNVVLGWGDIAFMTLCAIMVFAFGFVVGLDRGRSSGDREAQDRYDAFHNPGRIKR